jgi:MFS family permease
MTEDKAGFQGRWIIFGGVMIFAIGQSLLFIVVSPMARAVGLSEQAFGLAISIANITLIFASPFWGKKSDKIGRKPVFIVGLFGSAIGTLFMTLSLNSAMTGLVGSTGLFFLLIISRAVYGLTVSSIYPASSAYIADITSWQDRAKGMALIGSANSLGSILGPVFGGLLATVGVLAPMWVAVVMSFIAGVLAIFLLVEPAQHKQRKKQKIKSTLKITDARLRPYMIMWACFFIIFISLNIVTPFFIQDRFGLDDPKEVIREASKALISMAVVITIVQGVFLQKFRVRPQTLLRICGPTFSAGLFIMAFSTSMPMLMMGYAVLGFSFACATPGINGSCSLTMQPHEQGAAAGFLAVGNNMGAVLGPVVGTSVYQIAPSAPMLAGGILFVFLSVYALFIKPPEAYAKDKAETEPAEPATPPAPANDS